VNRAFAGADAVFWLVPPNPTAESLEAAYLDFTQPACGALKSCGVRRVVGVSALGRGTALARNAGLVTASLAMDDLIASTGVGYRALTMPSFMDNMLRQAASIRDRGSFSLPIDGDRKLPTCATRDMAAVAACLLLDPAWSGRADVPVLGPEDLSCNDMAGIMSDVLGKPVRFQRLSLEAFGAGLAERGMSPAFVQGYADMYAAKSDGLDNAEPRTPQSTTQTSFRQWCEEVLKAIMRCALAPGQIVPDDAEVIDRDVREVGAAGAFADRPNPGRARLQPFVDTNVAAVIDFDAGLIESDPGRVRDPAYGDQDVAALDRALARSRLHDKADLLSRSAAHMRRLGREEDIDLFGSKNPTHLFRNVGILLGHQLRPMLKDCDPAAEATASLSQLETDIAAPDHNQV